MVDIQVRVEDPSGVNAVSLWKGDTRLDYSPQPNGPASVTTTLTWDTESEANASISLTVRATDDIGEISERGLGPALVENPLFVEVNNLLTRHVWGVFTHRQSGDTLWADWLDPEGTAVVEMLLFEGDSLDLEWVIDRPRAFGNESYRLGVLLGASFSPYVVFGGGSPVGYSIDNITGAGTFFHWLASNEGAVEWHPAYDIGLVTERPVCANSWFNSKNCSLPPGADRLDFGYWKMESFTRAGVYEFATGSGRSAYWDIDDNLLEVGSGDTHLLMPANFPAAAAIWVSAALPQAAPSQDSDGKQFMSDDGSSELPSTEPPPRN